MVSLIRWDMASLENSAARASRLSLKHGDLTVYVMCQYYLAVSSYLRNSLVESLAYADAALKGQFSARPGWIMQCYLVKCLVLLAQKRMKELNACRYEMEQFADNFESQTYREYGRLITLEVLLRIGELKKARKLANETDLGIPIVFHWFYCHNLTEVKLLLSIGTAGMLERAKHILEQLHENAKRVHNANLEVQVKCLQCLLLWKLNRNSESVKLLKKTIELNGPQDIKRIYTDLGAEMAEIFADESVSQKHDPFVQSVITSFQFDESYQNTATHPATKPPVSDISSLTERESAILMLISQGLRNKEIAESLFLSEGTVKGYIFKLYKKIGAKNRVQATSIFQDLNRRSKPDS